MTFYDLDAKTPAGQTLPMSNFKGKLILVVNTATQCGLTPQFSGLEKLHQDYKDKGLVVIGFPCNQFMSQEPLTNDQMEESCRINHGVSFQLTQKVDVNGRNTHPVFAFLKKSLGNWFTRRVKWNFTKFLIDQNGIPVQRYAPTINPEAIEADIRKLL
jgi:glutathione peroxidase